MATEYASVHMDIIYTQESVEGQPGPNVYWRGSPVEFFQLLIDLHALGVSSGISISLENLKYIRLVNIKSYQMRSLDNGDKLAQIEDGTVLTELAPAIWEEFLHKILSITFGCGFCYVEDLCRTPLVGDATIIMSSEA
jgi:hypothetical protein